MTPSEIWWNYVPVGISIKDTIEQQIQAGKCVLLDASHLPWRENLLESVQASVESNDVELNWNVIHADAVTGCDPLAYLGSYYGVDEIPVKEIIQQRIQQLHTCCWVKHIPESDAPAWIQMARELFGGKGKLKFRLVLELPTVPLRGIGKIVVVGAKIEHFDVYYFALSILAASRLCPSFREYAAMLCAEFANGDIERCYALCRNIDTVLKNPLAGCKTPEEEALQKQLVCRAQTRCISPLIDIGRLKLLSIFNERVAVILPQKDDYDNDIDNINMVELRHLVYFLRKGWLSLTTKEKDWLSCLYDARNTISHLNFLSYDEIQDLFRVLDELAK